MLIIETANISRVGSFSLSTLLILVWAAGSMAQTTSFTYQGRLTYGGTPASGTYEIQFTLWDAPVGGTQQPQPVPINQNGFEYWSNRLNQCGSNLLCLRSQRIDLSNAFFFELEFQQTGSYVFRLHRAAFGNNQPFPNPDSSNPAEAQKLPSYAVFASDRTRVVGGAGLAESQLALADLLVQRAEFVARYPLSLDGRSFINAVLATLREDSGVDLRAEGAALMATFDSGGRAAVMYRLADDNAQTSTIKNQAFIDAEYNRAFVFTQYAGYLRRDSDLAGFQFWLGWVNSAPVRNVRMQHALVCSFITSSEYQQLFSSVLTHSNAECP